MGAVRIVVLGPERPFTLAAFSKAQVATRNMASAALAEMSGAVSERVAAACQRTLAGLEDRLAEFQIKQVWAARALAPWLLLLFLWF